MNVGVVGVVEGLTRRRMVATGAARHLGGFLGAVIGVVGCGYALGYGPGNEWFGQEGFFLSGVDFSPEAAGDSATAAARIFLLVGQSAFFVSLVMAALAERTTFAAHIVCGLIAGGLLVPSTQRALDPVGILGSISVNDSSFVDSSAASIFAMAGWLGLLGAMVIGPRLGWIGANGNVRVIPGKSPWIVGAGSLLFVAGSAGLSSIPDAQWDDRVSNAAMALLLGATAGGCIAAAIGVRRHGRVTVFGLAAGLLAGVVATSGALLHVGPIGALVLGAIGGGVAQVAAIALERWRIDDPAGAVSAFGAAGVVGSLGARAFDLDQLLAQVIGQLIIAAWSIVVAGLVFGTLRAVRVLRVSRDIEMVGLDR